MVGWGIMIMAIRRTTVTDMAMDAVWVMVITV